MAAIYFIFSIFFALLSLVIVALSYKFIRQDGKPTSRFNRTTLYFGLSHLAFLLVPILHQLEIDSQIFFIVLGNLLLLCSAVEALLLYRSWRLLSDIFIERYIWLGVAATITYLTYLQFYGTFSDRVTWMTSIAIFLYGWQVLELFRNKSVDGVFQRRAIIVLLAISSGLLFIRSQVVAGNIGKEYTSFLTEGIITVVIQWGWCTLVIFNYLVIGSVYIERNLREQIRLAKELETSEKVNTRLKDLLADKNALLKRLSMAEKTGMFGALASSLAHELNQPLCATKLNIDTLKQVVNDQHQSHLMFEILDNLEKDNLRIEKIIQRVDKLFRRGSSVFTDIRLTQLVNDCCDLLSKDMEKLGITTHINVDSSITIVGDHGQLETVILNLLGNARDALQNANYARTINIDTALDNQSVRFSITDNGPGIETSTPEQLFDPFYTTKENGMGIGLWLTKSIIEHHNATITASNTLNSGAKFEIVFSVHHGLVS